MRRGGFFGGPLGANVLICSGCVLPPPPPVEQRERGETEAGSKLLSEEEGLTLKPPPPMSLKGGLESLAKLMICLNCDSLLYVQWRVCVKLLVESILGLQRAVQRLAAVVMASIAGTKALLAVAGLLHGVRVVQQVIVRVEVIVVVAVMLLRRWRVRALATLAIDNLVALIGVHLVAKVCEKVKCVKPRDNTE